MATLMALPGEVGTLRSEFHGFRVEMRDFQVEMRAFKVEMRDFQVEMRNFQEEMRLFQDVVASNFTRLEKRINDGEAETRRLMLALHDDLASRIAALAEGRT
jgi:hypothetical protein